MSRQQLTLWASCFAQLIVVLDVSVVNVALPSIQADLGLRSDAASWVATAYSLGFAGLLLVGARLADAVGTLRLLTWGTAAFTVASVIGGLAPEGWVLIAARAAQGVSAATVSPATFTLLTTTFAEGPGRTRAIAMWTAVSLTGGGLGTIASGALTEWFSWRATLLINLPVGVGVIIAASRLRGQPARARGPAKVDLLGAILAAAAFSSATLALSAAGESSLRHLPLVAGSAALALFVALGLQQRRTKYALVPGALAKDRGIIAGNLAVMLTGACFQVSLWYFMTFRMQSQFGYSPLEAGLAFLPLTTCLLAVNLWVTPRLMERHAPRSLIVAGVAVAGAGLAWLVVVTQGSFATAVLLPSILLGIGGGLVNTPLATVVTTGVAPEHAGAASGLMNTAKQFGGALGLAAAAAGSSALGSDRAAFVLMLVALLGVAVTMAATPVSRAAQWRGA